MRRLAVDPADVVVVIDADCQADPGLVRAIADLAHTRGRPVQSRNTLWADSGASPAQQMVLLAFIVKGLVRQRGLARLGAPCFLQGTGMAFPWEALRHATLASEKTAMDMRLTIELALAGHEAIHFEPLGVRSPLLPPGRAAESQRRRWEHGHMETALREVPRLLHAAAKQRRLSLLVLALDMCVPPLALWVWSWGGAIALASIAAVLSGSYFAVSVLSLAGLLVAGSVLAAWTRFGRSSIPGRVLLRAPAYLVGKLPLYHAFFRRRGNRWTPRDELGGRKR
jgi:cellulose synthase/poly-beta-1,6-N-acetylglucosamine synthase-like glycosyltransferase